MNAKRKPALRLEVTDAVTRLVLTRALEDYHDAERLRARNARRGWGEFTGLADDTRERMAAGCEARATRARELFAALEGDA